VVFIEYLGSSKEARLQFFDVLSKECLVAATEVTVTSRGQCYKTFSFSGKETKQARIFVYGNPFKPGMFAG
jgi:hypothetical protein